MEKKTKFITRKQLDRIASRARSIGYLLSMAAFGLVGSSLGPVLPDLAAQVSVPIQTIGVIFTARAGGFLIGSFISGKIFDRVKGHIFLVLCFLAQAMALAFTPFIEDIWLLAAVLFFSGITLGFIVVGASTFIVWQHAENPAPMVSTQSFLNGMGNFLSPLVISLVVSSRGEYARAYWIYAFAYILLSILFFYTPSPEIRSALEMKDEEQESDQKSRIILLISLIFLLYTGSEVTYNSWVFSIATTAYPFSDAAGRLLNSLFWGALAAGRIFVGFLSRKFSPSKILSISFTGAVLSFVISIVFPRFSWVLWVSTISAGLFMSVIFPTLLLYVEKRMRLSSTMSGTFFMATSVGGMLLPWIAGQLFAFMNPHWVKAVMIFCLSSAALLFQSIDKRYFHKKG